MFHLRGGDAMLSFIRDHLLAALDAVSDYLDPYHEASVVVKTGLVIIAIIVGWFHYAHAWEQVPMNVQIDQTNFLLNTGCSATLVDKDKGILLTANHCIAEQYTVVEREKYDDKGKQTTEKVRVSVPGTVSQLVFRGPNEVSRTSYVFKIIKSDSDSDLALVQVQAKLPNWQDAKIACMQPARGDAAYAVGNPQGLYSSVSNGIIASTQRNYRALGLDGDNGLTQSTTPIGGGSSGGALYNDRGEIIGVVVRGYQAIAPVALSVQLSDIQEFVKSVMPDKATCS
jgi:S1-C subfamily serine protease